MLSLERRDARKELGIGGGGGGREMMTEEETELEEGEACSYHSPNNDDDDDEDYDAAMDPDVALSYLDEKLQHVLGHFQKDFEGGVSAENLGAKFGGYGSFLSSQRSPVWSRPRTPPNVQQCSNLPKSPNTLQYGAGRQSCDSSGAPQAARPGPTSASAAAPLASTKMPSLTVASLKQERRMPSALLSEEVIGRETLTKKSDNLPDPKMLKFRIKVGSDNLSTQTNDALYNGLGLNVSPSSSMEDSPSESEGMSHDLHHTSFESPAHIIRIMTSFPVHGGLVLSPLPDFLIRLTEKERLPRDGGSTTVSKFSKKMLGLDKMKLLERCELSSESKSDYKKVSESDIEIASTKEMVLDNLACDRLVSHTLRLPLLSSTYSTTGEMVKGLEMASNSSKEVCKDGVPDNAVLGQEKVLFIPMTSQEDDCIVNRNATTLGDRKDKKDKSLDSASECSSKGGSRRRGKSSNSVRIEANISKVGKALRAESTESIKHKADQKIASKKFDGEKFIPSKESLPSEGKKKPKKSQSHGNVVTEIAKAGSIVGPYSSAGSRKDSHADDSTEGEFEDLKVHKTVGKPGDRYRDFFGDMELEQEDSHLSPLETSRADRVKVSRMVEKETHGINKSLTERSNGKKNDTLLASEAYIKPGSSAALRPQSVPALDAAPVSTDPVVTEDDHWVCCDKCQTWRLLPFGKNPDDLPDNWLCEMLDWLPGMNRCGFSEEETTEALFALYRAAAPNGQSGPAGDSGGPMTEGTLRSVRTHDAIAASRKKKHALREPSNITNKDGPTQLPNSAKKAVLTSVPNGGISKVSRSPRISEPDLLKSSRSGDAAMGKQKPKLKEKHQVLDKVSEAGERQSKMRSKRASDEDLVRASKKVKAEDFPEDPVFENVSEKVGLSIPSVKLRPKGTDRTSSKDSKNDQKDQKNVSAIKPKDEIQVTLDVWSVEKRKHKDVETVKRRKANEDFDANVRPSSPVSTEPLLQDGGMMAKEEFSDSDFRKEKKARLSRSIGKEVNAGKGDGRTEKKDGHGRKQQSRQDLGSTLSQRSLDGIECLKKDSENRHPQVAAISSSSKVSGSHRTKGNILDTKGSPVESVSSLPIGTPKPDKFASATKNTERHVNRKCSDEEDEGFGDRFAKGKQQSVPTVDSTNQQIATATVDFSDKDAQRHSRSENKDKHQNDERPNGNHSQSNGSRSRKSTKGSSSSRSKDRSFDSSLENGKARVSDCTTVHAASFEAKPGDGKNKADLKIGGKSDKKENSYMDKSSAGVSLAGNGKTDARPNVGGHNGPGDKRLDTNTLDAKLGLPLEGQVSSGKEKAMSSNSCGGIQEEKSLSVPGTLKGNGGNVLSVSISGGDNPSKPQKQTRKVDHPPNGINHSSGSQISNGHRIRDHDAPSPAKRDSSSQAANNALKEAKNLKHLADRLKNTGSDQESTRLYFEASLKFLHGASLLESGTDMIQLIHTYTSTAKLCEFCAHEYEKSRDMAAAALAYKCMEVAYLRVIHCSHSSANRDRLELQMALQMVPTGESPSSSASDIDNLNHPTAVDKVTFGKGISSPQVTGGHIIAPRNRTNVSRLLTFAQNVNCAMEASRKSRTAFAAASISLGDSQSREGIASIKTALDFSFHDVEGLLRLIRLAVEAISR